MEAQKPYLKPMFAMNEYTWRLVKHYGADFGTYIRLVLYRYDIPVRARSMYIIS